MFDNLNGFVAPGCTILVTRDGWITWTRQAIGGLGFVEEISFKDSLNGVMAGGYGVYLTTDGGSTWMWDSLYSSWLGHGAEGRLLPSVWAIQNGYLYKTTNTGGTWTTLFSSACYCENIYGIQFLDELTGWTAGTYSLFKTTNGGRICENKCLRIGESFYSLDAVDQDHIWTCSDRGIVATNDGGTTWARQDSGVGWPLYAIDMADNLLGISVGGGYFGIRPPYVPYRVHRRTTNGQTWQGSTTRDQFPLRGINLLTSSLGWACGDSGNILRTSDGGVTWQNQTSNVRNNLSWITFKDSLHGWTCGSSGCVLWTTDGGTTWNSGNSGTTTSLGKMAFYDTTHGFAIGSLGLIIETNDGGRTWLRDTTFLSNYFLGIFALDSTHVWAGGTNGILLGRKKAGSVGTEIRDYENNDEKPFRFALGQSYPNPTRGIASFEYELGKAEKVRVRVYNTAGQAVRTLVEGMEPAGRHVVVWDGRDESGRKAGSGTYFYCFEAGERKAVRKMVVIR